MPSPTPLPPSPVKKQPGNETFRSGGSGGDVVVAARFVLNAAASVCEGGALSMVLVGSNRAEGCVGIDVELPFTARLPAKRRWGARTHGVIDQLFQVGAWGKGDGG